MSRDSWTVTSYIEAPNTSVRNTTTSSSLRKIVIDDLLNVTCYNVSVILQTCKRRICDILGNIACLDYSHYWQHSMYALITYSPYNCLGEALRLLNMMSRAGDIYSQFSLVWTVFSVQPFVVVTGVVESITARSGWPDVSTGSVEYTTGGAGWTAVGLPKAGWTAVGLPKAGWTAVGLPKAGWTAVGLPKAGWTAVGLPNDTLLTTGWVELSRMWFRFLYGSYSCSVSRECTISDLAFCWGPSQVSIGQLDHGSELLDRCEEAGDLLRAGHADTSSCSVVLEVSLSFHRDLGACPRSLSEESIVLCDHRGALPDLEACCQSALFVDTTAPSRDLAHSVSLSSWRGSLFEFGVLRSRLSVDISVKTSHAGMASSLTGLRSMRWQNVDRCQTRLEKAHRSRWRSVSLLKQHLSSDMASAFCEQSEISSSSPQWWASLRHWRRTCLYQPLPKVCLVFRAAGAFHAVALVGVLGRCDMIWLWYRCHDWCWSSTRSLSLWV